MCHYSYFAAWSLKKSSSFLRQLTCVGVLAVIFFSTPGYSETSPTDNQYPETAYPVVDYGTGPEANSIKHGEYLVKAGDCIACHTAPNGKPFAGGLAIPTPFGTIYSQNITSDKQTGIGSWSDDDFVKAMREGISPQGNYYFPVFPYVYFNKLSRQDVLDIKAYLEAIPAVEEKNRPLDMPWPFSIRELQSFWRFMFFDFYKGQYVPDNRNSPEWNRGAYLVQGLGHCSLCHSPLNALGAVKEKYDLTGGFVEGYRAPNISASGLHDVPTEKVLEVFLKDKLLSGGAVKGPMLQVNHDSLRYLSIDDLSAIVTYLRTVESQMPPAPKVGTGEKAGKAIYEQYCAGCHTTGGGGAPKLGDAAQWGPLMANGTEKLYENAINGINGMPPRGTCDSCSDEQVKIAVDYIITKLPKTGEAAAAAVPEAQSLTSLARGKQIYDQVCSICHAEGKLGAPRLGDKEAWEPLIRENVDVLVRHAIKGYKGHPARGACYECTDADIISAVKYMAQESGMGNYKLW